MCCEVDTDDDLNLRARHNEVVCAVGVIGDGWRNGKESYDMAHPVDLVLDATVLHILDLNVRQTLVTARLLAGPAAAWFGTPLLTDHRGILGNRLQASHPYSAHKQDLPRQGLTQLLFL